MPNLSYSPLKWDSNKKTFTHGSEMAAGTGITTGSGTICKHSVTMRDGIIKTEILIDLTGLHDGDGANDIIGVNGGSLACHIGQITDAINGTIIAGKVECFEAPTGGDPDIDIYSANEPSGAQAAAASGLVETKLVDTGDHSVGSADYFTAFPTNGQYLYLVCGTNTGGTYTAGRLLITLWGYRK